MTAAQHLAAAEELLASAADVGRYMVPAREAFNHTAHEHLLAAAEARAQAAAAVP